MAKMKTGMFFGTGKMGIGKTGIDILGMGKKWKWDSLIFLASKKSQTEVT